jgi:hypothetical protein
MTHTYQRFNALLRILKSEETVNPNYWDIFQEIWTEELRSFEKSAKVFQPNQHNITKKTEFSATQH